MCFSLPIEWSILPRFIWSQMILTVETNLSCYWVNHIEVPLLSSFHQPLVVALLAIGFVTLAQWDGRVLPPIITQNFTSI